MVRLCRARAERGTVARGVLVGLTLAFVPPAHALELEFSKAPPCPVDEISFRVEKALAEPLANIAGPTFRVGIERVATGYLGRVDAPAASGDAGLSSSDAAPLRSSERRVTAASCDELVDTLALTLVLAIAGQRDAKTSPGEPPPPPADEAARALDANGADGADGAAHAAESASEADAAGPRLGAFGAMIGDAGSLPAFGLGAAVGADIAWPSVELRALGMFLPGAEGSVDARDPASPGAELGLIAGALLVCAPLSTRVVGAAAAACLGAELGRLSGHGTRIDTSHSSSTWWSAPRVDLGGRWALPLPWLAIELGITLAAPIWRDEFVLDGVGSVHRPAPVVGRASLSLRADFGP